MCHDMGYFTEYILLVLGGHQENCLLFINAIPEMTKYMENVIRKHTHQAPKQCIGPLILWSA